MCTLPAYQRLSGLSSADMQAGLALELEGEEVAVMAMVVTVAMVVVLLGSARCLERAARAGLDVSAPSQILWQIPYS